MNNEIDIKTLKPFTRFICTIGELPTSYVVSMSYEEQLLWLCNYLEKTVIPTLNNNSLATQELQERFIELKEYVESYFDNLDIQEEVDNKLDEMYENGQLQSLIEQFIDLTVTFTYNNVEELKEATNLINGSFVRTSGFYEYDDGGGANYKIRNVTTQDNIDESTIIALNDPTLVAELIVNNELNILSLGCKTGNENDNSSLINNAITKYSIKKLIIPKGDFYVDDTIEIENYNNLELINYGVIHALSSATAENPIFYINNSNNIKLNNINITSTLDQTEPAPQGHTRIDYDGSNRIAINLNKCKNIEINNLQAENMYGDIWVWNTTDDVYNSYVYINNWKSKNATNPLYASHIEYMYINNSHVIAKEDLGYGNHFLYFQKWVHDIYINNSNFFVNDNNLGAGIIFVNSFQDEATTIYNIFIDNITMTSPNLFVLGTNGVCNFKISNSIFKQKNRSDNKAQNGFIIYSNSEVDIINCTFYDMNNVMLGLTIEDTENIRANFKDCNFVNINTGTSNNTLFNLGKITNNNLTLDNCKLNCGRIIYVGSTATNNKYIVKNCIINSNDPNYLVSVRNNSDSLILINNIATALTTVSNIVYNGGSYAATGISILNNFFYGYNRFASVTESNACTKIGSYLNNTLIS